MSKYQITIPADAPPWGKRLQAPFNDVFNRIGTQINRLISQTEGTTPAPSLLLEKLSADPPTGPGVGRARLYVVQGTGATATLRMQAGTSATPIDIAVDIGGGF